MVAFLEDSERATFVLHADERRTSERQALNARVEGRRMDHALTSLRDPVLSLMLQDISAGGLGAVSQTPIARGERVSVFFPPCGASRGWDASGRVVRCIAAGSSYQVGIEFEQRAAA